MNQMMSLPAEPPETATLSEHAFQQLQAAIVRGDIAPGSKISEPELARAYGISRGPLREALHRLLLRRPEAAGAHPSCGARVVSLSQHELSELYQIREASKAWPAACAAERLRPARSRSCAACCRRMSRHDAFQAGRGYYEQEGDYDFHYRIVQGSGNRMLFACSAKNCTSSPACTASSIRPRPTVPRQAFAEHHRILDAIADGDGELAEMLMRRHIRTSRLNIERQIRRKIRRTSHEHSIPQALPGTALDYFDTRAAVEAIAPGAYDRLPYTSRVLAENLVRRCDPRSWPTR